MVCRHCSSQAVVKIGFQSGKQRFRCKACGKTTTENAQKGFPAEIKQKAVALYLEGLGFRAIGRLLGASNVAVLKWIRQAAQQLPLPEKPATVQVLELDEVWHFVKKRAESSGCGLLLTVSETVSLTSNWAAVVHKP